MKRLFQCIITANIYTEEEAVSLITEAQIDCNKHHNNDEDDRHDEVCGMSIKEALKHAFVETDENEYNNYVNACVQETEY